jgi:hypothetical protein
MPGFLVSSGGGSTLDGQANTVMYKNIGTASAILFTASNKTRINSCLMVNTYGTILPIAVYIKNAQNQFNYLTKGTRVHQRRHVIMPKTDNDPRTEGGSGENENPSEIVLDAGESLCAVTVINNSFDAILSIQENVQ